MPNRSFEATGFKGIGRGRDAPLADISNGMTFGITASRCVGATFATANPNRTSAAVQTDGPKNYHGVPPVQQRGK
jgi:hypothetical protein